MKLRKLGDLWKRQEELKMLINAYETELREIEERINVIMGENVTSYKQIYDDEEIVCLLN